MYNNNQSNLFDHAILPKLSSSVSSLNSDDDIDTTNIMRKDRRRELHTQAEQRRRDAIKSGYDSLLPLIHPSSESNGSKLSKATILQRTIFQIKTLNEQTTLKEKELENLKNELFALRIMNSSYEEMAKCNKNQVKATEANEVPENVKFEIFGQFLKQLFQSFDKSTKFDNFCTASTTIIHWVEEYCKPQNLNVLVESVLTDVLTNYHSSHNRPINVDLVSNNDLAMEQDQLNCYIESLGRSSSSISNQPINYCVPIINDVKTFKKPVNHRHSLPSTINNSDLQSQSLTNSLQSINPSIDDEFLSMSPNALELDFLNSLDQNNLIDDIWLQ